MTLMNERARLAALAALPLLGLAIGGLAGCASCDAPSADTKEGNAEMTTKTDRPLESEINAKRASFASRADDSTKRLYQDGIDDVLRQGVLDRAVNEGDNAPNFTLPNASGADVELASLLNEGPAILVWYRGGWCPYCNITLRAYQERLDEINGLGATLVAISPELPDNALSTKEKGGLEFEVLTDLNNRVAREYGVVFDLTPGVHENYNKAFGLDGHNGQATGELPLAATYVIDTDGRVTYAFLHHDYRERAEPSDVLAALRATAR